MEERIRSVIAQWAGLDRPVSTLSGREDLYEAGLSSLATVQLLMAIEVEFGIEVPDAMLTRALFQNIDSIGETISALQLHPHAS